MLAAHVSHVSVSCFMFHVPSVALRRESFNVLAMGQHLDDLAESMIMSIFHNGFLRTMKANYHVAKGYEQREGQLDGWTLKRGMLTWIRQTHVL